ncbi:MAG TPA: TRAM domain-containing protein [Candidatus Saccharimonadales bacterium]|jgi:uncharacterized protein YacL|nr:TRAM domain-containing protein [Candidatus Saccharimonadales bacterium]
MIYLNTGLLIVIILILLKNSIKFKSPKNRKIILDTCALIDGRILELSKSGFIPDELIVPEFIIHELQMLADGSDSRKRSRARYGLDVVKELQNSPNCKLIINKLEMKSEVQTDDKLVKLAKKLNLPLYTTDYNLNKVAEISGVSVLNVNELAQQLRPEILPGEQESIKLIQKGSNQSQAVGYLDDGTMVVVNNATKLIGQTVKVEISRSLQTAAGKMLFAELVK